MADDANFKSYSVAAIYKHIVWTEDNLFVFLKAPKIFIPGTKMIFDGIQSEKDRKGMVSISVDVLYVLCILFTHRSHHLFKGSDY